MRTIKVKTGSAITVVNGIILGKGAAIGTQKVNSVTIEPSNSMKISTNPQTDHKLINEVIELFQSTSNCEVENVKISTNSPIPPSKGLKTSSSISCALFSALAKYYDTELGDDKIVRLSAKASIEAGVSITGALDDAYASYLGDFYVTDNYKFNIIKHHPVREKLDILFLIPEDTTPKDTIDIDFDYLDQYLLEKALDHAIRGNFREAISINSRVYAQYLLDDFQTINELEDMLQVKIGLNGAGPALYAILEDNKEDVIKTIEDNYSSYNLFFTTTRGTN